MKKFKKAKSGFKNKTKLNYKKSKKLFTKTADGVHRKNLTDRTQMRGGYRI